MSPWLGLPYYQALRSARLAADAPGLVLLVRPPSACIASGEIRVVRVREFDHPQLGKQTEWLIAYPHYERLRFGEDQRSGRKNRRNGRKQRHE